jgi:hypothetical protein
VRRVFVAVGFAVGLLAGFAGGARGDGTRRHEAPEGAFDVPTAWKLESVADVSAPFAVKLTPPIDGKRSPVAAMFVLIGTKKLGDAELDAEAGGWHAAHLKNRVAWGVRSDGGMPRDVLRGPGGRRLLRYRDRVGSALGANEQSLTCGVFGGRLACVITFAAADAREDADELASNLLASLSVKRR